MSRTISRFHIQMARLGLFALLSLVLVQSLSAQYNNRRRYASEWTQVECPVEDNLHLIHFLDNNRGWILSDSSGVLLGTSDGGQSWQVEAQLDPGYYEVLTTTDDGTLWIAGDGGRILTRAIDGTTFTPRGALNKTIALYDLMPVYLPGEDEYFKLFASGVRLSDGVMKPWIARSDTRGRSWERFGEEFEGRFVSALAQSSLGFVYAACEGSIYTSLTGSPRTWIDIYNTTESATIRDLEIDPEANGGAIFGLAAGHDGLVLATFNGGRNWLRAEPFTTNRLRKALVLDTQTGWVVGDATVDAGICWKTEDRGANWQLKRLPYDDISLHDIGATETALYVIGTDGTIYTMPR